VQINGGGIAKELDIFNICSSLPPTPTSITWEEFYRASDFLSSGMFFNKIADNA
jgi:hypothetical protein